jgi:hypothetical protein
LLVLLAASLLPADDDVVLFDAPSSVAVHSIKANGRTGADVNGKLIAIRLQISTLLAQPADVEEIVVTLEPSSSTFKVLDFLPQTTLDSRYDGPLTFKTTDDQQIGLSLDTSGLYKGLSAAVLNTKLGEAHQQLTEFKLQPPKDVVAASGTIQRGQGVYFKLRPSAQETLEGAKEFLVISQVHEGWRGDLLRVRCVAKGRPAIRRDFLVAMYLVSDAEAHGRAEQFSAAERELRLVAGAQRKQMARDAAPKLLQRIGVTHPALSPQWFSDWLYGEFKPEVAERLPKEVRTAALRYSAAREELHALSGDNGEEVIRARIED